MLIRRMAQSGWNVLLSLSKAVTFSFILFFNTFPAPLFLEAGGWKCVIIFWKSNKSAMYYIVIIKSMFVSVINLSPVCFSPVCFPARQFTQFFPPGSASVKFFVFHFRVRHYVRYCDESFPEAVPKIWRFAGSTTNLYKIPCESLWPELSNDV